MGIGQNFMEKTKYQNLPESPQRKGFPQPLLELPHPADVELINLPDPNDLALSKLDLADLIKRRETLRNYADISLSMEELSFLLWTTQGVKIVTDRPVVKRTVPSAGSRHAFETYLLVNKVEGLDPGLYRYVSLQHKLFSLKIKADIAKRLAAACLNQSHVYNSAVTFIWVAVPARMIWRYSERGYRYIHLDAGHVCQNLYLAAEAIKCGVCAIAAFDDNALNKTLNLDGEKMFVIYLASLGKR